MQVVVHRLIESPLLTLFVVAAAGYLLGRIRIAGVHLGVAAVLFCGLAVGALDQRLALPELVPLFGLVLFVYMLGLSSGATFFASLRRKGLRDSGVALTAVLVSAGVALAVGAALGLPAERMAGLFAGALTNTPALAAVVEQLEGTAEAARNAPIIAYSLAYPLGVIGALVAVLLARWLGRAAPAEERRPEPLQNATVRVTQAEACEGTGKELLARHGLALAVSRLRRAGQLRVFDGQDERLELGDELVLVGPAAELARAFSIIGPRLEEPLELDRRVLDFRRIAVSSAKCAGRTLGELDLHGRFGATVTRIRRGDVELVATDELALELGDRVRVVAPRERLAQVSQFFGDSYRALGEIDVVSVGLGICLGLLLGQVAVPLPGDAHFSLGNAGGPLIVGLVLGRLGRTGPMVWNLPYDANQTLRQLGLVLFLAGVGTRSGHAFLSTLQSGHALPLLAAGLAITLSAAMVSVLVGRALGIPTERLSGVVAAAHTQPAALAFAVDKAGGDGPNAGYASAFPIATIAKIIAAQLLLSLAR